MMLLIFITLWVLGFGYTLFKRYRQIKKRIRQINQIINEQKDQEGESQEGKAEKTDPYN